MTPEPARGPRRPWATIALEVLVCAAAAYGGAGLAWRNVLRMPDGWLEHGPFTSWLLPGLLLLLVVALPMGLAAVLELRRSPWAAAASVAAGAAPVAWIGAELLLLQKYDVLQPVVLGAGLLVLLLAVWTSRHRPLVPEGRPGATAAGELRGDRLATTR